MVTRTEDIKAVKLPDYFTGEEEKFARIQIVTWRFLFIKLVETKTILHLCD